ncbi:uncharacterized protein LOC112010319 [Quercus suber]|uniref:uncharacterized protein LOC112010319 n=1 Tax=Quercus suber TaxID=58331 RepID=UPI000CE1BAEC|nr:uncharacterized protein LOC112010319 [Quercus suber]
MRVDEVAKQASSGAKLTSTNVMMEVQEHPIIEEILTLTIQSKDSWITSILSYLQDGWLLQDIEEARKVKKRAARFTIMNDSLYKRGFPMPYLKCIDESEAKYILEEVHEGICRDHTSPRSLVSKIIRTSYFWSTMQKDAREFIERYDKCQRFGNVLHIPAERLMPITSPWPFA